MEAKFLALIILVAAVQGSVVPMIPKAQDTNDYTSFEYAVGDPHTDNYKNQVEIRVNGTVKDQYSLIDSDGTKPVVEYTADDAKGSNTVVRKVPLASKEIVSPTVISTPVPPPPVYATRSLSPDSFASPPLYPTTSFYSDKSYETPYYYPQSPYSYKSYYQPSYY